jgi:hypothetical protein
MLVVALGDLGDRYVELRGDEVDAAVPLAAALDAERLASPIDHM